MMCDIQGIVSLFCFRFSMNFSGKPNCLLTGLRVYHVGFSSKSNYLDHLHTKYLNPKHRYKTTCHPSDLAKTIKLYEELSTPLEQSHFNQQTHKTR